MKLTFENWLNGEIELHETYKNRIPNIDSSEFETYQKCLQPVALFSEIERSKISESQKLYFDKLSQNLYDKIYTNFKDRYNASGYLLSVLEEELFILEQILEGEVQEDSTRVFFKRHNLSMTISDFSNFNNYVQRILNRGFEPYYDFMPSSNSRYYNTDHNPIPEVFAQVIFRLRVKISKMHPNPALIRRIPREFLKEPINKFPEIFSNGWAYKAFRIIEETVAVNPNTYNSDYGLIYNCLHFEKIQAILMDVDRLTFVNFVNSKYDEEIITAGSMKISQKLDKNRAIRFGLKYYLKNIKFEGDIDKIIKSITK